MKHVIIGASIAAAGAIAAIRSITPDDEIVIINGEGRELYSRPLISYYLAADGQQEMSYPEPDFFSHNNVTVINDWAMAINRADKTVRLKNNQSVNYDRLLLATGSVPARIPLAGSDTVPVYNFYTLDDAQALKELAPTITNAVVVGSGLIGIKAAEALHSAGVKVAVLEREASILPRMLSAVHAARAVSAMGKLGITCITGCEVTGLGHGKAELADGTILPADLVIMAAGVKPRTELALDCGLAVERGITVNELLQTSDPAIFAAGDVVQVMNLSSGQPEIMALLPLAREQGWVAGINMAGHRQTYPGGVPLNAVRVGELAINSGGLSNNQNLSWRIWQQGDCYLELFARDNKLVGFIALNMPAVCGPLYNTLNKSLDLGIDEWQRFMATPAISTVPPAYWTELRRCTGNDNLKCS